MNSMKILASSTLTLALAGAIGAPAHAVDELDQTLEALTLVSDEAGSGTTDPLGGLAPVRSTTSGPDILDATVADVDVTVPRESSDPIVLDDGAMSVGITLPFAGQSSSADPLAQGLVAYDNDNGSTTAVGVKLDGSVQMTTTIEGASSPFEYEYRLDLPSGATLAATPSGGVTISDAAGNYLAGIAPAWALDADGATIATRYRIEGATVIQEVDHRRAGVAYPVVADPWLGIALISSTTWSGNTLKVYPTDYGRWGASAARSAAWDEVKAKTPGTRENTSSMTDQFLCHYDVRPITSTKPSWNLDLNRPYVNYLVLLANKCNN